MKVALAQNWLTSSTKSMVCAIIMGFAQTRSGLSAQVSKRSRFKI